MKRFTATLLWSLLGLSLWVLALQAPFAQATGRRLSRPDLLPPCTQVPDGVAGWDCTDRPVVQPLRPCDFHHQRIGVDCSEWTPVRRPGEASSATFQSKTRPLEEHHSAVHLPRCTRSHLANGVDSWICSNAPAHQGPLAIGSDVGKTSPATVTGGRVEAELPPCSQVPRGIPGWDCYDPPDHPLPPCDFHHQRIGFDCWGWTPVVAP